MAWQTTMKATTARVEDATSDLLWSWKGKLVEEYMRMSILAIILSVIRTN